jgi:glutaminyl-tRNA synthetase
MSTPAKPNSLPNESPIPVDSNAKTVGHLTNFVRNRIEAELAEGKFADRRWAGKPAVASAHATGLIDPAAIRTRFPPEPNGYLHIGHAKSICLNFGLALDYNGQCHMRFDDTNPVKEDQEYVDAILDSVRWLGFNWDHPNANGEVESNLYFASDYFETIYTCAAALIESGDAYVDSQSPEQMRQTRGTLTQAGTNSPYRNRSIAENLELFRKMRAGEFADGTHIVRAKIDMASPNINMRDPALYRIRRAHHHRTADAWCIYPMYDFAHPISDALENITHSICTLEFADHRPFYDWVLTNLADLKILKQPVPEQIEFARLNLTSVVTSKRKLQQLVQEGIVHGWDDPRLPTLFGLRRRGYTPESIRLFCDRIGVSKADGWIDYATLEQALRDDLEGRAQRAMAILDPVELLIENAPTDWTESCSAPVHPQQPERGTRTFSIGHKLWIDRSDFQVQPEKGFHRLFVGNRVRLKYGYVIECTGYDVNETGQVIRVKATYFEDSRSGTSGANNYKVKGVITWLNQADALPIKINAYDRLFLNDQPGTSDSDFLTEINPNSLVILQGYIEPSIASAMSVTHFQFERFGYFVRDGQWDSSNGNHGNPSNGPQWTGAFNSAVGLKDNRK